MYLYIYIHMYICYIVCDAQPISREKTDSCTFRAVALRSNDSAAGNHAGCLRLQRMESGVGMSRCAMPEPRGLSLIWWITICQCQSSLAALETFSGDRKVVTAGDGLYDSPTSPKCTISSHRLGGPMHPK